MRAKLRNFGQRADARMPAGTTGPTCRVPRRAPIASWLAPVSLRALRREIPGGVESVADARPSLRSRSVIVKRPGSDLELIGHESNGGRRSGGNIIGAEPQVT